MYISPGQEPDARSATVWERVDAQTDVDLALRSRAAVELENRLQHWNGDYLPRPTRFKNKKPVNLGTHLIVPADPIELVIVRAVAMTEGAAQFGVSPNGAIFTAEGFGNTIRGPRVDVTRVSWLLDEAADILQQIRRGKGGRFYERDGQFFMADDKTTILEVVDEADLGEALAPSRPLFQRIINTVLRREEDQRPQRGARLSEDVLRARTAPIRRRTKPVADGAPIDRQCPSRRRSRAAGSGRPQLCPKHFTEMPANGQCDECRTD